MKFLHLSALTLLATFFAFAACSKDEESPVDNEKTVTKDLVYSALGPGTDEYWKAVDSGIDLGLNKNFKRKKLFQLDENDANTLANAFVGATVDKDHVAGIIGVAFNAEVEAAALKAVNSGVRVVLVDCPVANSLLVDACHAIVLPNLNYADSLFNVVMTQCGTENVLFVGQTITTASIQRYERFRTLCGTHQCTWHGVGLTSARFAYDSVSNYISDHPSVTNVVLLNGSSLSTELYEYVCAHSLSLYVVDRNSVSQKAFDEGHVRCLVQQQPDLMGKVAAQKLMEDEPEGDKITYIPVLFRYSSDN